MTLTMKAIVPKGTLINVVGLEAKLSDVLNEFVSTANEELATYPVQWPQSAAVYGRAKRSYTSKKGRKFPAGRRVLKSGYDRTGTLGKSWSWVPATRVGNALVAKLGSEGTIAPYNVYVQGNKQSRDMQKRGWKTARFMVLKHWPLAVAKIHRIFKQAS
jgi:hypothetical protein